jgi:iron(III) transport system permease protein
LIFCLTILGFSAGLPVMVLLNAAGKLSNYIKVLKTSWQQISYSLILAFSGAFFTLGLGFFLSYLIERGKIKFGRLLELCALIPLAVPAITIGVGLIHVWNRPTADLVYASSFIILFGYMARFTPFTVLIVTSGLKQLNPNMEEAASLVTDRWTATMGKIVIPLMGPGLITAFFIVFVLAFRELGTTLLVIPPGRETLPIKIYNLMHYGAEQKVAALCLIMLLIIFAFSGTFLSIQNRFKKSAMHDNH